MQWKHANIIPIFKKGDKSNPTNYRPISLLSCVGKIFERVMFKHFYNYLHSNNLLYNMQSGFIPGHSTTTQLIEIYHNICLALDNREFACFTFCDISKAFDRVWIQGLIHKLKAYGFAGNILHWISDYLTNRTHQTVLNQCKSVVGKPSAGVPQGSVLGPLLFLVFINDLPDGLLGLSRLFADDTSISHQSDSVLDIVRDTNIDMENISKWSKDWLVEFNPSKTKILLFGNRRDELTNMTFMFDGSEIDPVHSHKHLGVIFTDNGKWTEHINSIVEKVTKQLAVLRKLKYMLNRDVLNKLYTTFIRPHFEYTCEVWDNITETDSTRLDRLQHEATRIVTGLPKFCSIASLYAEIGWEMLKSRREKRKLCQMYKIKTGQAPDYLSNIVPPEVGEATRYSLRNNRDIQQFNCRLSIMKTSFFPSTIDRWNNLPIDIRNSTSLLSFKRKLNSLSPQTCPPKYYNNGQRQFNIIHARLRRECSSLNADLYKINLSDTYLCRCGSGVENAKHYFLECELYDNIRPSLVRTIAHNGGRCDIKTILYGNPSLNFDRNQRIFKAVHTYIKQSNRF